MQVRLILAVAAWSLVGQAALAQSALGPDGPAEIPPQSFTDAQYVDSRGCVYFRAGLNDQVMWVPRVTKDRKPLCGYAPSLAVLAPVVEQAVDVAAPLASASTVEAEVQPTAPARKKTRRKPAAARTLAPVRCAAEAPLLAQVPLVSGGMAVLCLSGDARMVPQTAILRFEGAIPLVPGAGQVVVCPRAAKVLQRVPILSGGTTLLCTEGTGSLAKLSLPKLRPGSEAVAGDTGSFVQVATFEQPANAARTKAWLAQLGLPVATGRVARRGQKLEVIFAGPFFLNDTANATLSMVRTAGFDDAFLR